MLLRPLFALAALLVATHAWAQAPSVDVPGSSDHPLIKRFAGSWLAGERNLEWEGVIVPAGPTLNKQDSRKFQDVLELEGKLSQRLYVAPRGKAALEVWRNYEQALAAAGFKKRWSCERDCSNLYFAWNKQMEPTKGFLWAKGDVNTPSGSRYSLTSALSADEGRMLVGTLGAPGKEATVLLYSSVAANASTGLVATYVQILEPRAMQTGQVSVEAAALGQGLAADGKVTLAGLFFDTGKTEIKPESQAQLDEMVKLLQAQPALKVLIVGHTDNVGSIEANLALSLGRAQAAVAALGQRGIAPARLQARGVANFAPLASNADEAGRARNRRVELVQQ